MEIKGGVQAGSIVSDQNTIQHCYSHLPPCELGGDFADISQRVAWSCQGSLTSFKKSGTRESKIGKTERRAKRYLY
jgi:hypothetical protein